MKIRLPEFGTFNSPHAWCGHWTTYPGTFWPFNLFEFFWILKKTFLLIHVRAATSWQVGTYPTRTTTSFSTWFTRNNRHDSPKAGRSQRALGVTTLQSTCGLTNGHIDIHGNSLEDLPWRYQHQIWLGKWNEIS